MFVVNYWCKVVSVSKGVEMLNLVKRMARKGMQLIFLGWQEVYETAYACLKFPVVIVLLRGPLKGRGDQEVVTFLYVGRDANLFHFKNKYFKEVDTVLSRRANLLTYRSYMAAVVDDADVVFVDIGYPYHGRFLKTGEYLEIPDWIFLSAPIAETWDDTVQNFRKTMRKNIRRLIRKNNYRYEVETGQEAATEFYYDYYRKFINARYSTETVMTPLTEIKHRMQKGVILKVIGNDGPVAAGVYFPMDEEFCLLASGMPEALVDNPPEAAVSALYYFSMQYAFDHGYKAANFLGTRGFPDDGLFQFKRKWGAVVKDDFSVDSILFRPANTKGAAQFCARFPMIARRGEALELVMCSTAPELNADGVSRMVADTHCGGLDTVRVVHVSDQPTEIVLGSDAPKVEVRPTPVADFATSLVGLS